MFNSLPPMSPQGLSPEPELPCDPNTADDSILTSLEREELLLLHLIEELSSIITACRECPVPQQWIGSSVMFTFDVDARPTRANFDAEKMPPGAAATIAKARVFLFDWGRSELNTPERHAALGAKHKPRRDRYWGAYCGGLAMLLYDCCLVYVRRCVARDVHSAQIIASCVVHCSPVVHCGFPTRPNLGTPVVPCANFLHTNDPELCTLTDT